MLELIFKMQTRPLLWFQHWDNCHSKLEAEALYMSIEGRYDLLCYVCSSGGYSS